MAELRAKAGLSAAAVAARLSQMGLRVDRTTIYAYEAGRISAPDAGVIWGLAKVYRVPVEDLIAALVTARTSTSKIPPLPFDETVMELTSDEQDLVRSFRQLSSRDRADVRNFLTYRQFHARRSSPQSKPKRES